MTSSNVALRASSMILSNFPIVKLISNCALGNVEPDSRTSHQANSSACASSRSRARCRIATRSATGVAAHPGCAREAACAAAATSATDATPSEPSTAPLDLSMTSIVPALPSRQVPEKILPRQSVSSDQRAATEAVVIALLPLRDGRYVLVDTTGNSRRARRVISHNSCNPSRGTDRPSGRYECRSVFANQWCAYGSLLKAGTS